MDSVNGKGSRQRDVDRKKWEENWPFKQQKPKTIKEKKDE
jgi:hypothetical protein